MLVMKMDVELDGMKTWMATMLDPIWHRLLLPKNVEVDGME